MSKPRGVPRGGNHMSRWHISDHNRAARISVLFSATTPDLNRHSPNFAPSSGALNSHSSSNHLYSRSGHLVCRNAQSECACKFLKTVLPLKSLLRLRLAPYRTVLVRPGTEGLGRVWEAIAAVAHPTLTPTAWRLEGDVKPCSGGQGLTWEWNLAWESEAEAEAPSFAQPCACLRASWKVRTFLCVAILVQVVLAGRRWWGPGLRRECPEALKSWPLHGLAKSNRCPRKSP